MPTTTPVQQQDAAPVTTEPAELPVLDQDLLVEDVSIDGMCGVY